MCYLVTSCINARSKKRIKQSFLSTANIKKAAAEKLLTFNAPNRNLITSSKCSQTNKHQIKQTNSQGENKISH